MCVFWEREREFLCEKQNVYGAHTMRKQTKTVNLPEKQ